MKNHESSPLLARQIFLETKLPRRSAIAPNGVEGRSPHKSVVYFFGVGGIGMSALARWFKAQKMPISGSDLTKGLITSALAKEGAKVKIGHKRDHINQGIGLVIYSKAAKSGNPEIREARRLGIPTLSYPEAVGRLTRVYKTIAVAGAHGKSTTTALISLILIKAGLDPTVIIGTNLREFGNKNFRASHSRHNYLVLEADEFGKSFLHYSPTLAVITNIDIEHLDTYKNLTDIKNNFFKFLSNVNRRGTLVLNKDSKYLYSLKDRIQKLAKEKNLRVYWYSTSRHSRIFADLSSVLRIPGEHNISNAFAAYTVGRILGVPQKKILSAIGSYRGSWRRMEYRGGCQVSGVRCQVFDDYAHHPTEIRATLKAFREKYPRSPIICVYQPHQALRLKKLWHGFIDTFGAADVIILIPIYQVAGRDRIDPRFTSRKLALAIKHRLIRTGHGKMRKEIYYLANPAKIKTFLTKILEKRFGPSRSVSGPRKSALVVMMGAGDIVNYTNLLLKKQK